MPLPREFEETIRAKGLEDLLAWSELDSVRRGSLVKHEFGRSAPKIDRDAIADEADQQQELFCLYDYESGCIYTCEEQIGYAS